MRDAHLDRAAFADEIDDRLAAGAAGDLLDLGDFAAVSEHGVIGTAFLGQFERAFRPIDDDDLGSRQRLERLNANMAETSAARR